jgi:transposase InsO family protein
MSDPFRGPKVACEGPHAVAREIPLAGHRRPRKGTTETASIAPRHVSAPAVSYEGEAARVPLAVETLGTSPRGRVMARLLETAARTFSKPKYLITDLGREFYGKAFRKAVARRGIIQRFASKEISTPRPGWSASGGRSRKRPGSDSFVP